MKLDREAVFVSPILQQSLIRRSVLEPWSHSSMSRFMQAFALLTKRLKPLEQIGSLNNEFKDLCYLLTCKSIQDAPFFKSWEGVASSRYFSSAQVFISDTNDQHATLDYI